MLDWEEMKRLLDVVMLTGKWKAMKVVAVTDQGNYMTLTSPDPDEDLTFVEDVVKERVNNDVRTKNSGPYS